MARHFGLSALAWLFFWGVGVGVGVGLSLGLSVGLGVRVGVGMSECECVFFSVCMLPRVPAVLSPALVQPSKLHSYYLIAILRLGQVLEPAVLSFFFLISCFHSSLASRRVKA